MQVYDVPDAPYSDVMLSNDYSPTVRLAAFLDSLFDLLRIAAQSRFILFPVTVRGPLFEALRGLDEERLQRLRYDVAEGAFPDFDLEALGLQGNELDAKLQGYATARSGFHMRGGISNLGRAVRWAKAILSSLTRATPYAEFLLELIDLIANGAQDIKDLEAGRL